MPSTPPNRYPSLRDVLPSTDAVWVYVLILATLSSSRRQRLVQVGDDIVHVLDADRQPHQVLGNAR